MAFGYWDSVLDGVVLGIGRRLDRSASGIWCSFISRGSHREQRTHRLIWWGRSLLVSRLNGSSRCSRRIWHLGGQSTSLAGRIHPRGSRKGGMAMIRELFSADEHWAL